MLNQFGKLSEQALLNKLKSSGKTYTAKLLGSAKNMDEIYVVIKIAKVLPRIGWEAEYFLTFPYPNILIYSYLNQQLRFAFSKPAIPYKPQQQYFYSIANYDKYLSAKEKDISNYQVYVNQQRIQVRNIINFAIIPKVVEVTPQLLLKYIGYLEIEDLGLAIKLLKIKEFWPKQKHKELLFTLIKVCKSKSHLLKGVKLLGLIVDIIDQTHFKSQANHFKATQFRPGEYQNLIKNVVFVGIGRKTWLLLKQLIVFVMLQDRQQVYECIKQMLPVCKKGLKSNNWFKSSFQLLNQIYDFKNIKDIDSKKQIQQIQKCQSKLNTAQINKLIEKLTNLRQTVQVGIPLTNSALLELKKTMPAPKPGLFEQRQVEVPKPGMLDNSWGAAPKPGKFDQRLSDTSSSYFQKDQTFFQGIQREDLKGLPNIGLTCYLNSILMALYQNQGLHRLIKQQKPKGTLLQKLGQVFSGIQEQKQKEIMSVYLYQLQTSFTQAFKRNEQQDCHQFMLNLFQKFESELSADLKLKFINLFRIQTEKIITCYYRHTVTMRENQPILIINLTPTTKQQSLEQLIKNLTKQESLYDYYCEGCRRKQQAYSKQRFDVLPQSLLIMLGRTQFDKWKGEFKVKDYIYIDRSLTIQGKNYRLQGFVVHIGMHSSMGHYKLYWWSKKEGAWFCYNDESVHQVIFNQSKPLQQNFDEYQNPYLLFYKIT